MIKKLCLLLLFGINSLSFAQYARFPEIALEKCEETYITDQTILECEQNNAVRAKATLDDFLPRLYNFLPKELGETSTIAQFNWDKLTLTECELAYAMHTASTVKEINILHCINQKSYRRLQDLIYSVVLWENTLGHFQ